MPGNPLAYQEPLELLHQIQTSQAVAAEQLRTIAQHLEKLNGRVGRSEERLSALETLTAEARGAGKFIGLLWSIPSGLIAAAAVWYSQHAGGK